MLRGSEDIKAVLRKRVGEPGHVTADGMFSWNEVECLGACCNAPMVQINDDYYEDLTPENFSKLLDDLAAGRPVKTGSQIGRVSSEPVGGLTALTTLYGVDGRGGQAGAPAPANDERSAGAPIDEAAAHAHAAAEEAHINEALSKLRSDATPEEKANAVGTRPSGHDRRARRRGGRPAAHQGRRPGQREAPARDSGSSISTRSPHGQRAEIRWVGTYLAFPGRIDREQWVAQATNLAHGGAGSKDGGAHVHLDAKPGH